MRYLVVLALIGHVFCADPSMANENVNSFDSVDKNDDGKVDFAEFEQWQKQKLFVKDESKIKNVFAKYDLDKSHSLEVPEFVPLAYAISSKPVDVVNDIFKRMDVNNDGVVDVAEQALIRAAGEGSIIDGILLVADSNHDGKLTYNEYETALSFSKPRTKAEINRESAASLMAYMDSNSDNKLDKLEIHTFANQYAKVSQAEVSLAVNQLDLNQDGLLTIEELERLPERMTALLKLTTPPTL